MLTSTALMRLCARGPSGTFTASTPARRSAVTSCSIRLASTPRGGTISTDVTNSPRASFAAHRERSANGDGRDAASATDAPPSASASGLRVTRACTRESRPPPADCLHGRVRGRVRRHRQSPGRADVAGRAAGHQSAIARMCSGVVPQQPPTILAPACTRWRAYVAMYSGLAMYMLRPPTSRGIPAFGCAESLRRVAGTIRSIASRIVCGPTEQLSPMTSAPNRSSARATSCGGTPYGVRPSTPIVICAMTGIAGIDVARCANGLLHLVQVGEGLDDEAIGAAVGQRRHLLAKHRPRLVPTRRTVRLDADAERADGTRDEAVDRQPQRAPSRAARRLSSRDLRLETVLRELRRDWRRSCWSPAPRRPLARTPRARRAPAPVRAAFSSS